MVEIIRMPAVLAGAAEAGVQTWLVAPGSSLIVGQPMAEIETEKAIVELVAEAAGTVGRLLVAEGDNVTVGEPILALRGDGEGDDAIDSALAAAGVLGEREAPATVDRNAGVELVTPNEPDDDSGQRQFASPLVRKLAADAQVTLTDIVGTGPRGRIVRRDLERHLAGLAKVPTALAGPPVDSVLSASPAVGPAQDPPLAAFEDVPLDRMRKAIARRLTESKATVPHFYLEADCRVDALLELRRSVNATAARRVSLNDFVLKAVAAALIEVPGANAVWNGDSIRRFSSVDISVAVATEGGLVTPVVRAVEQRSLSSVSASVVELAERARAGRLRQQELEGGSFAVSNLGMYGTSRFAAILNSPQSGILAVGAARPMPVVGDDGGIVVAQIMTVTLSADHRVLDGAVAAEWLAAFQRHVENPLGTLI